MSEILSREEWLLSRIFGEDHPPELVADLQATIEALAEALAIIDEDDGFQLAKTSLDAMQPLRDKGWL